ncbi:IS66 family insertion sequence element accessory protein TnpA [Roseomonas mucosa]|uniref:IS66 family insertion sequence element accessory protein TnpA n=1 Tax=Roseomonas mucosa TaxID=207340 RepID=UPI003DA70EA6
MPQSELHLRRRSELEQGEVAWAAHIEAQAGSGETQRAYCKRHGLAPRSFRAWQEPHLSRSPSSAARPGRRASPCSPGAG